MVEQYFQYEWLIFYGKENPKLIFFIKFKYQP